MAGGKIQGCGKQRAPHRSRLVRFVNSPHPTPALGWTFAIGTFVSSGGFCPVLSLQLWLSPHKIHTGSNSIFTFLPSAAAALTKVVKVKLVSSSSNNRLSEALLVCIFFAIAVLLSFFIVPTLLRGNTVDDAPASQYAPLERCGMHSLAGAWER